MSHPRAPRSRTTTGGRWSPTSACSMQKPTAPIGGRPSRSCSVSTPTANRSEPGAGASFPLDQLYYAYQFDAALYAKYLRGYARSEEHTSELQSLMRISYAVFCLKKKTN